MEKSLLLQTLRGKPAHRPPVWYMRQAGRVLPSYMELKKKYPFWQMMKDPRLGAEVTLLPVNDLGVDAAILFSDILVIPYAMGMEPEFTEKGPVFAKPLAKSPNPLNELKPDAGKLEYVYRVIEKIKETKPADIPLIGFCGGPLTVLCYMLEGMSRNADFPEAVKYLYQNRKATRQITGAVEELSLEYVKSQVRHGIDVFQLFETHAGLIPFGLYKEMFMPVVKKIAAMLRDLNIPFIYFPKDIGFGLKEVTPDYCDYLSIDWQTPIEMARQAVDPEIGLQGNLDPRILFSDKGTIEETLKKYLHFGRENRNWVFNLGHGFRPGTPFDNAKFMTEFIKQADWSR